jgi:hypothetical protein
MTLDLAIQIGGFLVFLAGFAWGLVTWIVAQFAARDKDIADAQKSISDHKLHAAETFPKAIDQEIALLERQRKALKARDDLLTYTQFTMPDPGGAERRHRSRYKATKLHVEVAKALTAFIKGELKNPTARLQPAHLRDAAAARQDPAFDQEPVGVGQRKVPEWDIAVASYSDTMAEDMGADTRAIMTRRSSNRFSRRTGCAAAAREEQHPDREGRAARLRRPRRRADRPRHDARHRRRPLQGPRRGPLADHPRPGVELVHEGLHDPPHGAEARHSDDDALALRRHHRPHDRPGKPELQRDRSAQVEDHSAAGDRRRRRPARPQTGEALWPERYDLDFLQASSGSIRSASRRSTSSGRRSPTARCSAARTSSATRRRTCPRTALLLRADHAVGTKQRNDPSCFGKVGVDKQSNIYSPNCIWERMATDRAVEQMLAMGGGLTTRRCSGGRKAATSASRSARS